MTGAGVRAWGVHDRTHTTYTRTEYGNHVMKGAGVRAWGVHVRTHTTHTRTVYGNDVCVCARRGQWLVLVALVVAASLLDGTHAAQLTVTTSNSNSSWAKVQYTTHCQTVLYSIHTAHCCRHVYEHEGAYSSLLQMCV